MNKINIEKLENKNHYKDNRYGKDRYELKTVDKKNNIHEVSIIQVWGSWECWIVDDERIFEPITFSNFNEAINYAITYLNYFKFDN